VKRYFLLFVVILLSASAYAACYDDDGGVNYKKKGICKDTNNTEAADSCIKDGLVEYYCINNACAAQLRTCETCKEGVCLSKEADNVIEVNKPPTANFLVMVIPGKTEVAFSADVSDPEGSMVVFTIDFGDGTKSSNKAYVSHDYKTVNQTFTATLVAMDSSGAKTTASKTFTIEPQKMVEAPKKEAKSEKTDPDGTTKKGFFARIIDFFKNLF
jgi:PKD repeat protein